MADSPFEIVTTKKGGKVAPKKIVIGLVVLVFLVLGVLAGAFLVRQQQDIREEAAGTCTERCPNPQDGSLYSCSPPEAGGSPAVSECDTRFVGRVESCGGRQFCCNGTAWGTNLAACATTTPTRTPTATPTRTPTPTTQSGQTQGGTGGTTPTKTPSPTPTKTATVAPTQTGQQAAQATKPPVPETGTGLPTILVMALGMLVIIGSFILAF